MPQLPKKEDGVRKHHSEKTTDSRNGDGRISKASREQMSPKSQTIVTNEEDGESKSMLPKTEVKWWVEWSRIVVEHKFFVALTTVLTVYALIGDDLRLMWTNMPADVWFDCFVLTCLVIFTVEVVLSVLGKEDYFMSFFFILDVISTGTLILDFSPVSEMIAGSSEDDDNVSSLRSGRTARIGAKAGRIVRVIRLVRIIKLYKAIHEARARKKARLEAAMKDGDQPGEWDDEWDDDELDMNGDAKAAQAKESRVGKKLSDITIRRVIMLVLSLLLVLPNLAAQGSSQLPTSGWYGADQVWQAYESWQADPSSTDKKSDYEQALLTYVFFHNWYADRGYCNGAEHLSCANRYFSHLFWIGVMGPKGNEANIRTMAESAQLSKAIITNFSDTVAKYTNDIYVYGTMPPEAKEILSQPWTTQKCDTEKKLRYGISLLSQQIDGVVGYEVKCPDDLRSAESQKFYTRLMTTNQWLNEQYMVFYFDLRPFVRTDAGFNLSVTGFICLVLCAAALMFTNDANKLILHPVENMIQRVEQIRKDPLVAMRMADEEFKAELISQAKKKRTGNLSSSLCKELKNCKGYLSSPAEPMETVILEKTIIKLGSLLALGFGEAGAAIIGHNMRGSDSAGVNAMIPGKSVNCILGMARIRNFSTANEVLKGSIMNFANQIAEIVHGVCNEYHGAANKNNGDSFLMIWQIEQDDLRERMSELACVAFARAIGSLHRSHLLAEYRVHPGLQQRLGTTTRVNMNFGLHYGWAIEGAVGSEFKIDASYLSPTVSVCLGVERASTMYGVPFILAESVFEKLGDKMQERMRLIDRVILSGNPSPMKLFAVDLDVNAVKVGSAPLKIPWNPRQRFKARQFIETEKMAKLATDLDPVTLFDSDENIIAMRRRYTEEFLQNFNMGYQNYSQGEWAVAKKMLQQAEEILGVDDGPSSALLRFMKSHEYVAPKEWMPPGVRDLSKEKALTSAS